MDPMPSGRIIAGPFIVGTQVSVRISAVVPGVKYILHFVVVTNNINTISLFTHMPGEAPF